MNEHRRVTTQFLIDYLYFLKFPQPNDGAAMVRTVHVLNRTFFYLNKEIDMAAKAKNPSKDIGVPPNDLKWINRNLTEDEKSDHDRQAKNAKELGVLLFTVALQGYNIRIAWDAYSKCFQANLVPYQPENPNFGYAISARGATPERSVSLLLYKHYAVFREQWASFYSQPVSSFEG